MLTLLRGNLNPARRARAMGSPAAGALVVFEGRVRAMAGRKRVARIEYEAYPALARTGFAAIERAARRRFGVLDIQCVHRIGTVPAGATAVWIGVLAHHRRAAFRACAFVMDELKRRLPVWKQEIYTDGTRRWIEHPAGGRGR